ncbi:hypothetical protein ASE69_11135 [Sphingomonas sp. Leaf208]|uniref:DUF6894 family protein n=1 Tax=Sphingomonas sp. Leaf208 TaxID=1735679 RepID=UPI0006FFCDCC|nr:hypothetical protein [Sphingomonas sp. Leaf208]KQM49318.1 hypothetical protein ASE69_11135 [Sphingomonas sp. Leaf208]
MRYFFHTADGSRDRDMEGTELPDHRAARIEATKFAGACMNDNPNELWETGDFRIEVTDERDTLLFAII